MVGSVRQMVLSGRCQVAIRPDVMVSRQPPSWTRWWCFSHQGSMLLIRTFGVRHQTFPSPNVELSGDERLVSDTKRSYEFCNASSPAISPQQPHVLNQHGAQQP